MKATDIYKELQQIGTVKDLTLVFESIASLRIAHIKGHVASSQKYFDSLWQTYTQLRVDVGQASSWARGEVTKNNCYLILTSEGGLSGSLDERIVTTALNGYNPADTDIIVIGTHGEVLLGQHKIKPKRFFRLPPQEQLIDVRPIIAELLSYHKPTIFYQMYKSLAVQEVGRVDLLARVQTLATQGKPTTEPDPSTISAYDYVFEPNVKAVVEYLESVMMGVAVNQFILESRLAQYASRFNAMYAASERAGKLSTETGRIYHHSKRAESDERAKEIINAMAVMA